MVIKVDTYDCVPLGSMPNVEVVAAPPAGAAIFPLDTIKQHLRLDPDETAEDDLLSQIAGAATEYVETICSMSILPRTIRFYMNEWPRDSMITFPMRPIRNVISVNYVDPNTSGSVELDPSLYRVRNFRIGDSIVPAFGETWPDPQRDFDSVMVEAEVGYAPVGVAPDPIDYGANVPRALKQALLLCIGDLYENRESQAVSNRIYSSMFENRTFRRLIADFRPWRF